MKDRFSWSKQRRESGLAGIGQLCEGLELRVNGQIMAHVRPDTRGVLPMDREIIGWYWYGELPTGKSFNSLREKLRFPSRDEAQAHAIQTYKEQLAEVRAKKEEGDAA